MGIQAPKNYLCIYIKDMVFGKRKGKRKAADKAKADAIADMADKEMGRLIQDRDAAIAHLARCKETSKEKLTELEAELDKEIQKFHIEASGRTTNTIELTKCRVANASLRAEKDEQLPKKLTAELGKRVTSSDTWKTLAKIGKHGSRISVVAPNSEPRHPLRVPGGLVAPSTVQAEQMASEEARAAEAEQRREAEIEAAKKPPTLRMGWNLDRSAVAGFDTPSGFRPLPVRNSRGGGRRRYKSKKRLRARKKLSIRLHKQRNKRQTKKRQTKRRQTKRRH